MFQCSLFAIATSVSVVGAGQFRQSVGVLELGTVLVLAHIKRHFAAFLHHTLFILQILVQDLGALFRCDSAQRLGTLVTYHFVFGRIA
uniref:Putative secreted protein n=1 Tax=Anopheles triannulatus TaxID=58253 RepID=A0A2M4B2Y0_9DIPT